MADLLQFVDSIAVNPTVRLDLNNETPWAVNYDGTDLSPPPLLSAWADTLLADGAEQVASAYGNRTLRLRLELMTSTVDAQATALQNLHREMDRPSNFLRWWPDGATHPVFFATMRAAGNRVTEYPTGKLRVVEVQIPADPHGYGLEQTFTATVYNDPEEGSALNPNPYFETNTTGWNVTGATFVRSTAQFHEGVASGLLTPDGVTAVPEAGTVLTDVAATPGTVYRASTWARCAVARNVNIDIKFYTAASVLITAFQQTFALAANSWTKMESAGLAPALTAFTRMALSMTGTPPSSNTLHVDEGRINVPGSAGGLSFDVSGVLGDVETPLYLSISNAAPGLVGRTSAIAVRRRGTVSQVQLVLQAEAMTAGVDTSLQTNDPVMSGSGSNYMRTTFATTTAMADRLTIGPWPNVTNAGIRGTYRVFARVRRSVGGTDVVTMQLNVLYNGFSVAGTPVTTQQVSSSLRWVDLGLITLPGGSGPVTRGPTGVELSARGNVSLVLKAARTAGTSNLDIDCLVFLPADDRLALIAWATASGADSFEVDPAEERAYSLVGGAVASDSPMGIAGAPPYVSPGVTNRVYFMRQVGPYDSGSGSDDKTTTTSIVCSYWPRYLVVRPAAT